MAKKKQPASETQELENAYTDMTGYPVSENAAPKKRKGLIIGICIAAALVIIGLIAGIVIYQQLEKLPILQNVKVAGVNVGGMTVDQAEEAVIKAIGEDYATKDLTIQIFDETLTIPAQLSGGALNVKKAVRAARNYGQVGLPGTVNQQKLIASTTGYDVNLESCMDIDKGAITDLLEPYNEKYNTELKQHSWTVEGTTPTLDDLSSGKLDLKLIVTMGSSEYKFNIKEIYNQIIDAYSKRIFSIVGNCTKTDPDAVKLDDVLAKHQIKAQDAYLDPQTWQPVESHNGFGFNTEEAQNTLDTAEPGSQVTIPFVLIEPELTTQELKDRMFRDTLSTYTTKSSSSSARKTNLRLACQAIDGYIMNPGDVFDYNAVVGERTSARGFKAADAYVSGETVKTIGGGVCQVSSTIYYCALMADMEIVTRKNHSYPSSYIPLGMDATVSWGGPEFRFRNNSNHPIKISAKATGGNVSISIMSYDDRDYYVKMEYEVLSKSSYSVVYKDFPADNPEGYKNGQVITTPYTGYTVNSYRVKYDKATNKEISRTFEVKSSYKHRNKVVARVAAPAEPSTPTGPSGSDVIDQIG